MKVANLHELPAQGRGGGPLGEPAGQRQPCGRAGETTRRRGGTRRTRAAGSCRSGRRCGRPRRSSGRCSTRAFRRPGWRPRSPPPAPVRRPRARRSRRAAGARCSRPRARSRARRRACAARPSRPAAVRTEAQGFACSSTSPTFGCASPTEIFGANRCAPSMRTMRRRPKAPLPTSATRDALIDPDRRRRAQAPGLEGVEHRAVHHRLQGGEDAAGRPAPRSAPAGAPASGRRRCSSGRAGDRRTRSRPARGGGARPRASGAAANPDQREGQDAEEQALPRAEQQVSEERQRQRRVSEDLEHVHDPGVPAEMGDEAHPGAQPERALRSGVAQRPEQGDEADEGERQMPNPIQERK